MARAKRDQQLDEVLQFMRVIWALDHAVQSRSKAMGLKLGVTGLQRFVLRIVGRMPGITSAELSGMLHLHPSTLTGVLRRLEQRKLIERRRDRIDGRRGLLEITAMGARQLTEQKFTVEAVVREALSGEKPAQVLTLVGVLQRLTKALEEAPAPRIAR